MLAVHISISEEEEEERRFRAYPDLTLTAILPEVVTRHRRHQILHSRTAGRLRRGLRHLAKIVITTVPFHLPC
ncbi:hypothetical protein [Streptomyces sp. B22F1]|uniref:hypothetical protein n=1 Tax=Streptomyces sp. B22F1 TaxID=3153566 RepID=UPI00325CAF5E